MEYSSFRYLWPPRPEKAIPREMLGFYANRGWVAQCKMNGTCSVLAISPERQIFAMNRHEDEHKLWQPKPAHLQDFVKLPGKGWYVFVAELLHSKVPGIRDVNYVHDILVADGVQLAGTRFDQRQERLSWLLLNRKRGKSREMLTHWEITPTLWLAKNYVNGFGDLFDRLDRPEHEGLVLKNPAGTLSMCLREGDNSGWQVKCRRPHKNYSF